MRAEYPLAIARLQTAIKQAKQAGLLGAGIFESPFNFNIDLRIGAGAFVCGEETALMASVEGKRGTPRPCPPFPAESGLYDCPTLINNVETFANVAPIIRKGAEWFTGIGTEKSKGSKVLALAGKITNTGLIEVPMGTRLRRIVFAAEPLGPLPANFSKTRAIWEKAKRKVTGLDPRTLLQEQAFAHGGNPDIGSLRILHAGPDDGRSVRTRFRFFLPRKRTRHIVLLAAEGVIVPITGLAPFLPGPNIIFYVLAILMVIQWQALRGIGRMVGKEHEFAVDPVLTEWEAAVEAHDEARFPELLDRIEKTLGLPSPRKLLWK